VYEVPRVLHGEGLDRLVGERLGLELGDPDLSDWDELLEPDPQPARVVEIALSAST
jgi:CTP synthase (UTP-ammonia lyase)